MVAAASTTTPTEISALLPTTTTSTDSGGVTRRTNNNSSNNNNNTVSWWTLLAVAGIALSVVAVLVLSSAQKERAARINNEDDDKTTTKSLTHNHAWYMTVAFAVMTAATTCQRVVGNPNLPVVRTVQGTHGLLWTAALLVAVHAVYVNKQPQDKTSHDSKNAMISWHGVAGYIVLTLLAAQYLLGGRCLSLTTSRRRQQQQQQQQQGIANETLRDKHRLVQVHIGTGLGLYALFALLLTTALVQHKFAMTASLVAWTAISILLGLLLSL